MVARLRIIRLALRKFVPGFRSGLSPARVTLKPLRMRRVLIPSDNRGFVTELARAYAAHGWDAVVGRQNFELGTSRFDLVHFQWPEELCDWTPPTDGQVDQIVARVEYWSHRARFLLTVHNLAPHRHSDHPGFRRLYRELYARVPALAHFTDTSRRLVCSQFPEAGKQRNVVTGYFNWDCFLPKERKPVAARERLGFAADEFVVLVFGSMRDWAEVELVKQGFDGARIKGKRLLMAGRYQECGPVWRQRWRRWHWQRWLEGARAVVVDQFVPDEEVHAIIDAADVLLIPRARALNSGLPALAATFGKTWVAPDCGAFPEIDSNSHNPLYRCGEASSLGLALEEAFQLDQQMVKLENRKLADHWRWEKIVSIGLSAVGAE